MSSAPIDKVRASRDGHEFHEAWTARRALQLVFPADELIGIAVEGLSPVDQSKASPEVVEIADLTLYYGERPIFGEADAIAIVQVKYSISAADRSFRASDAKETIRKFADALRTLTTQHGSKAVREKLTFDLVTNRPVHPSLQEALSGLASGVELKGDAKRQADQLASACGLAGKRLRDFARSITISGLVGNLSQNKQRLARVLVDWSATEDISARARLGRLRQLVRDKAGSAGAGQNVITRVDVLDALELQGAEDLFPCPPAFPTIDRVVEREQLRAVASLIPTLDRPLLIHADGGVGKTIFLQSLADLLSVNHRAILFDCFGGGMYRAPDDARHLPRRGMVHIINLLACEGLCDPLLPTSGSPESLVRAFRARLTQAVATLRRGSADQRLLLFIDAIDNAAEIAKERHESSFPRLLLESLRYNGPIDGVHVIVSCRTHRRESAKGDLPCAEVELLAFNLTETANYLRGRDRAVTDTQIAIAFARSTGNPRILEHLAASDRGLLEPSEASEKLDLNDLLKERIENALEQALSRGYPRGQIDAFLAGLSVLPPPVPIDEYADAHGLDASAVRSFAADLAPLLEQTKYGLMFRDEPTETLIRSQYMGNSVSLHALADRLIMKQGQSVYAARALPGLLQRIGDADRLFALAFDERIPEAITSAVGRQHVRYARLKAAVAHAARGKHINRLVRLLVESSTLAASTERGTEYVLNNPDLVIASADVDATRRLFESRTRWPGTRHARLAIAHVLSGDYGEGYRHARSADEWIRHFHHQDEEYRRAKGGPESLDIAAIPLCLIAQDRGAEAARYMQGWKEWYGYELAEDLLGLLSQAQRMGTIAAAQISRFRNSLSGQPAVLAAGLADVNLSKPQRRRMVSEIAKVCNGRKIEIRNDSRRGEERRLEDGLVRAAVIALAMGWEGDAQTIASAVPNSRPHLYVYTDHWSYESLLPSIITTALRIATQQERPDERAVLPRELAVLAQKIPGGVTGEAFHSALRAQIKGQSTSSSASTSDSTALGPEAKREAERFVDEMLQPLLETIQATATVFAARWGSANRPFLHLLNLWGTLRTKQYGHWGDRSTGRLLDGIGRQCLTFASWVRTDLAEASVTAFVTEASKEGVTTAPTLVRIIAILATRPETQVLAGHSAERAKSLIDREDDVGHRVSLFAQLARAILPASRDDAAAYFRMGLDQMSAIGSGDQAFTHELLRFTATLKSDELEEADFQTLSNICELNMYEAEKFPWEVYASGLSRASGIRTLARLSRWDDRGTASLEYTLLPYLAALVDQGKIAPEIALSLLRLSEPAELRSCDTADLAQIIEAKGYPNAKELLEDLIHQFEQNHPDGSIPSTLASLAAVARRKLDPDQSASLSAAADHFDKLRSAEWRSYGSRSKLEPLDDDVDKFRRHRLKSILRTTKPNDESSMVQALDAVESMEDRYGARSEFLSALRARVQFGDRARYVQSIARLENLNIYSKLAELKTCKDLWAESSASIGHVLRGIAIPCVRMHAAQFVSSGYLSDSKLRELSEVTGIAVPELTLQLIEMFSGEDGDIPASCWIGLAAIISKQADAGEGQVAMKRLLNSGAAQLASNAVDGAFREGIYPQGGQTEVAAGFIWCALGSPYAARRWRAAHCIRALARFGRWDVIDAIVSKWSLSDAHPFQAPECRFFFLHARLWLLIAIARLAIDHPNAVAKHAPWLWSVVRNDSEPHVLWRHFAALALLTCSRSGGIQLSDTEETQLAAVNYSSLPLMKSKEYSSNAFYECRPKSIPPREPQFSLEYDFEKYDVSSLWEMFPPSRWETQDAITAWVRKYDREVKSMHETGGRDRRHERRSAWGLDSWVHSYGQQLGIHALYLTAGEFLAKHPVISRRYSDVDPWHEWLDRKALTRRDGYWLSDGVDRPPLEVCCNLCERKGKQTGLTGDRRRLLGLIGIDRSVADTLVVAADWLSTDDVTVHISSALVSSGIAYAQARGLAAEDPFGVWMPRTNDEGEEQPGAQKSLLRAWIGWPSSSVGLDGTDPYAVRAATGRPQFGCRVAGLERLKPADPFGRQWLLGEKVAAWTEAWGREPMHRDEEERGGSRLLLKSRVLQTVLSRERADLLVLIKLRRHLQEHGSYRAQYWHTTAVVRITRKLSCMFYVGAINQCRVVP